MKARALSPTFQSLLQTFFLQHLTADRGASMRTVEAYRDAFRLLLGFVSRQRKIQPVDLQLQDLDVPILLAFLDHLEKTRGNSVRTRNARLAAIKSFLRFASSRDVTALPVLQRSLAIPTKRHDKPMLGFMSREEMEIVLATPDRTRWSGERDFMLFTMAYNTGARVSELASMKVGDLRLHRGPMVSFVAKGRKARQVPLWKSNTNGLRSWVARVGGATATPLFPSRSGGHMTRSAIEKRLARMLTQATTRCPSLRGRRISPHSIRHSTAMHLLQSGVDLPTIALWLGHASVETTHGYVEADLTMKERALRKLAPVKHGRSRYQPGDKVLAFLDSLGGSSGSTATPEPGRTR